MMEEKKVLKEKKRNFRKKCEPFVVKDGILYHYPSKGKSALKEMVKDEDVGRILKAFHGDKAGGCHFGVTTTFTKLSERFWWKGMYDNVLKLVNSCLQCQQQNVVKKGPSELHPVPVPDRCFAQWGMDLVGPLKQTESGMEYIIVFTEYMTRWAEARAIPSKSALTLKSTFKHDNAIATIIIARTECN